MKNNNETDNEIFSIIADEEKRQLTSIELIASENFVSGDVLVAQGSILTNKYAEGYPNARYYGGCEFVDKIETLAIERVKKLFDCAYANVQPHSGSQANMAVYAALLQPGDIILGMGLNDGGHLTHGYSLSFSGQFYKSISYGVDEVTGLIDYEKLHELALTHKPKAIICGASSYSRLIDYKRFREISDEVGAYLIVDMAHIAGIVASKLIPSPLPYAHVVTSTTHKTLRGPRGGLILSNDVELGKKIDKSVFPGIQGGPLMHVIAAKAICFNEALQPTFVKYQKQVLENAKTIELEFKKLGYEIVSGETENHLLLVNVKKTIGITGKEAENLLGLVNITLNKNTIPYDKERPAKASGIRIGTPAVTTIGMKSEDMKYIVSLIHKTFINRDNKEVLLEIKNDVIKFMSLFNLNARSR